MSNRAKITLSEFKEKVKETLELFNDLPEEQKQEASLFWLDIVTQVEKDLADQGQVKTDVLHAQTKEIKEKGTVKRKRTLKCKNLKTVKSEADVSKTSVGEARAVSGLLEIQNKSGSQILNGQEIIREENVQMVQLNSDGKGSDVKVESVATKVLNVSSNQLEEFATLDTPEPVYIYPGLSPLKQDTPLASYGPEDVLHIQIEKTDGIFQRFVVKPAKIARKGKPLVLLEENAEIADNNESKETEKEEDSEVSNENEDNSSISSEHQRQKSSEKYLKCKKCSKTLSSSSALNIHLRSHSGDRPFPCSLCHKTFSTKGNMQRHERSHQGQKPHKCSECDSRFTEKKSLTVHMRRHTGERPFQCPHCHKSFMQSGTLQSHLLVHSGQKSHLCDTCGQAFRQKSQLKVHQKRHFDIREFKCDVCKYQSISKGDLDRHKLHHTGEKPFLCELCPKRFTRQQYLKEHMNVHKGTNPYKCNKCDFASSKMAILYRHKRRHSVEEMKMAKEKASGELQQYPNKENGESYPDDSNEQDGSKLDNFENPLVIQENSTDSVQQQDTGNTDSLQDIKVVQIAIVRSEHGEVTEGNKNTAPAVDQIAEKLPAQNVDLGAAKPQATAAECFIENS